MQHERRHDPYPWTWEPPTAYAGIVALSLCLGIHLGRALANLCAGAGWTWPGADSTGAAAGPRSPFGASFWTSLPGVLGGDAAAGLTPGQVDDVASAGLLRVFLVLIEAVVLLALVYALVLARRRWGRGHLVGMATPGQAEALLGRTRLRRVAPLVRPDLYGARVGPRRSARRRSVVP